MEVVRYSLVTAVTRVQNLARKNRYVIWYVGACPYKWVFSGSPTLMTTLLYTTTRAIERD